MRAPRTPSTKPPALVEAGFPADPVEQFRAWYATARAAAGDQADAVTLATVAADGRPSARMVLLRGIEPGGFVFYTNYTSRKARELEANPHAALVAHWPAQGRQVRIEGTIERVEASLSDAYFDGRPVGSRLGAIVSPQSQVVANREFLEGAARSLARELRRAHVLPRRPAHWGGYRVRHDRVEFWQAGRNRLHDRLRYRRESGGGWILERLAP